MRLLSGPHHALVGDLWFHLDPQVHVMVNADMNWYVIHTKPGMEKAAHRAIESAGIPSFYPEHIREISHARRHEKIRRPLFPQYTFAKFDTADQFGPWTNITRISCVLTILGMRKASRDFTDDQLKQIEGQRPTPIRTDIIEKMQALIETFGGTIPLQKMALEPFSVGIKVKIMDGPFEGFEGLVDEDHRVRVKVLLDIFGRRTPITLTRDVLALQH